MIIGCPEDKELVKDIVRYVRSFPEVQGAYDLILDNFGPNEMVGSIHIEVPDDMTAKQIHELTRRIAIGLCDRYKAIIIVGIYASSATGEFSAMRAALQKVVEKEPEILQVHGFFVDEKTKTVYFDLMLEFKTDDEAIEKKVVGEMAKLYLGYKFDVVINADYED